MAACFERSPDCDPNSGIIDESGSPTFTEVVSVRLKTV